MKIYRIPEKLRGIIFDIDKTLYRHEGYFLHQEEVIISSFATHKNISQEKASEMINRYRQSYAEIHEGRKPSLGNTCLHFGVSISRNVDWRKNGIRPADFLEQDSRLKETLTQLSGRWKIAAVTNNPHSVGLETLKALGVEDLLKTIIGLDTSGVSKPHSRPFSLASEQLDVPFEKMISIGDRFEIDLELPLELGMGAILVESMEDVYQLPGILQSFAGKS